MARYSELVAPPKLFVRRRTVDAMVEHAALVDTWIAEGHLKPINPGAPVELYRVRDVENVAELYAQKRL